MTTSRTATTIQTAFEAIFTRYLRARTEPFGKVNPVWTHFETIASTLKVAPALTSSDKLVVRWSAGQGRWATVPWIAIFNTRETSKPSQGVYVAYLFRADMGGVYATLNQGTSWILAGSSGRAELRKRAARLRERCGGLKAHGFEVQRGIDLRSDAELASGYEDSTIAFKLYARGAVPSNGPLLEELAHLLAAYEKLIPSRLILG
jgi:hypothetical protein